MARRLKESTLKTVIILLANEEALPKSCKDHKLTNSRKYVNVRECHLDPDWLLIYFIDNGTLSLHLVRTGTHSDLF